jgi:hypothetical protein
MQARDRHRETCINTDRENFGRQLQRKNEKTIKQIRDKHREKGNKTDRELQETVTEKKRKDGNTDKRQTQREV